MKHIILFVFLLVLSIYDWCTKKIPVWLAVSGAITAAGGGIYAGACSTDGWQSALLRLFSGMLPGVFLLLLAGFTHKIGWGDGVVLLTVGLTLGYRECMALFCFSVLAAAVFSVVLLMLHRADRHTTLPYLPFLTAVYLAELCI